MAERPHLTIATPRQQTAIQLVQSTRFARRLAQLLVFGLFLAVIGMAFLPWQQSSRGSGVVIAYAPQERQQTVQSPVKGVVDRVVEGLVEGSKVKKGDLILEIQPAAANMVQQLEGQRSELQTKANTATAKAEALSQNVEGYTDARDFTIKAASEMVEAAKAKLDGKRGLTPAYEAKELQARLNYERQNALFQAGIKPKKEIEKLKKEWDVSKAELQSLFSEIEALNKEYAAKQNEFEEKSRFAQVKIDYSRAMREDALGNASTARKEIREVEIKLSELSRLKITAPRDGTIFRLPVFERGQTVKEGEPLLTLVPDISQKAVELHVPGNDVPLMKVGDHVRLQFEGWPAVQFAGWPSVAIGTFGGKVATIDAADDGRGRFRILVVPDEKEQEWPDEQYLRQGARSNGWVMLRRVSLGYEIWRQLNGFPKTVSDGPPKQENSKTPKLPK